MKIRKEELNLLRIAKTIFGDIVINAFVCCTEYGLLYTHEENINKLNHCYSKCSDVSILNYSEIQLEFINGKVVGFTNSEWSEIFTPNIVDYKTL